MTDINSFCFTGRITGEPKVYQTKGGTPYIVFCLAVNRDKKEGDKWVKTAGFHYMSLYGERARSLYKYLVKGTPLGVQGHIDQDIWEDSLGKKNYRTILVPDNIALLGYKNPEAVSEEKTDSSVFNIASSSSFVVPEETASENFEMPDFEKPAEGGIF